MTIDFSGNVERFTGFADQYDQYRPGPPAGWADLLTQLARAPRPRLVVDLGSGTGLSSRYWAERAEQVIGIEPTGDMRRQAEARTEAGNVRYQTGYSHASGLPAACAQIVTCVQALHWMEPAGTYAEAARILAPGGVFAACDYDWPPATLNWEADAAYETCWRLVEAAEQARNVAAEIRHWSKSGHLERMRASGCFRYAAEIVAEQHELGNADRLVGLLRSQGNVRTLFKKGLTERDLGIDVFRQRVERLLGDAPRAWHWSARIRYGIV